MTGVNLVPVTVRYAQLRRRRTKRWGGLVCLAVLVVVVLLGYEWLQGVKAAELRAQNDRLQLERENLRAELTAATEQANDLLLRIERARALKAKRAWSRMFALIGTCMPSGTWLTSVATDPARPVPGNPRQAKDIGAEEEGGQGVVTIDAPRRLRISGYAPAAGQPHEFVTRLKTTQVFSSVVLERSQREPVYDDSYFRFDLICEW
jgi:hypothetical protein